MKKRKLLVLTAPALLGLTARLVCVWADKGAAGLVKPPGTPPLWLLWPIWTAVYLALGFALLFALSSGDARRYKAERTLIGAFGLYNMWPILIAGKLWLNLSVLTGAAVTVLAALCAVRFWRVDRRAGWCVTVFAVWSAYALYLSWGLAALN